MTLTFIQYSKTNKQTNKQTTKQNKTVSSDSVRRQIVFQVTVFIFILYVQVAGTYPVPISLTGTETQFRPIKLGLHSPTTIASQLTSPNLVTEGWFYIIKNYSLELLTRNHLGIPLFCIRYWKGRAPIVIVSGLISLSFNNLLSSRFVSSKLPNRIRNGRRLESVVETYQSSEDLRRRH